MAGKAVVGSLRVTLGLDSAQFSTGMKKAQTGLQRFGSMAKAGALAIGAAMVAAGSAMALMMKGVIDDADKMAKLSASIGVPIDELSRLRYAAELAGVDLDTLGKAVKRLSAGMLDSTEIATGPAARAFTMLGLSVRDAAGNMRPASEVMADLAGKFQRMPNGVEKTALAMRIFGKSGADMIPLLNAGSDGLREMYAEAEQLGIVLDEETGRAAEAFNDNLTRLGKVKDGIVTKITAGMLPALEDMTNSLVVTAKNSNLLRAVGGGLGWSLKALMSVALAVAGTFYALAKSVQIAATAVYHFARNDFARASSTIVIEGTKVQMALDSLNAIHSGLWSGGSGPAIVVEGLEAVELAASGAAGATRRLTDAQREQQRAAAEMAREAQSVYDQTRTPAEQYAAEVERLTRMLDAAAISQDTFNRAMREANIRRDADDPLSQAGRRIAEENRENADRAREEAIEFARDHEEYLYDATYDGVRGGLEAAADGNLGQYLASRIREALFDNLATSITDMLRGPKGKGGGGALGWLGAVGSIFKNGIPGFSKGVENFSGGLAYVHAGEVLTNLPRGTDVIPANEVGAGGAGRVVVEFRDGPAFAGKVLEVSGPVAVQAASTAYSATRSDMATAQRRSRQRFV